MGGVGEMCRVKKCFGGGYGYAGVTTACLEVLAGGQKPEERD